ncbi:hypothetical protein J2Z48_003112 [Croceifilum oryzae]|uniref:Uncharacterized protein n=1 Tax=Croceifilum oryzae TaxID=1553429 RepID=A0AAJ1TLU3_9BACL|nr:hypothetical protein [Croceifilum oryzae]MDQ0418907.1 hypothetical protein [Croceifilum oryzae]
MDKIMGLPIGRMERDRSWWEHLTYQAGCLEPDRIKSLQEELETKGRDAFIESFALEEYQIPLRYYPSMDQYYGSYDGTHRIVWAKLVNAPYIRAKVEVYERNEEMYRNYLSVAPHKARWREALQRCGLRQNSLQDQVMYQDHLVYPFRNRTTFLDEDDWLTLRVKERYKKDTHSLECCLTLHHEWQEKIKNQKWRNRLISVLSVIHQDSAYELLHDLYKLGWKKIE